MLLALKLSSKRDISSRFESSDLVSLASFFNHYFLRSLLLIERADIGIVQDGSD